jgi:N-acetylglucosaminyldiphosphoundecaprenol N-acetyl-beta-D-mannosaminyltransferase
MIQTQSQTIAERQQSFAAGKYNILQVPFDLVDYRAVMGIIGQWKRRGERHYVTLTPPYSVLMCYRDVELKEATTKAGLTLPDGVGIILAAGLLRYPHSGRVSGPTLMLRLCDWGRSEGLRHFFYGGLPGVADLLADKLSEQFPGLVVAGSYCPPFRRLSAEEDAQVIQYIGGCRPDIVWVGLGSPKQEKWMREHTGKINASALIGVGAAFDFHSGRVKWAPHWMRKAGVEWAYRLVKEPRRMWRRNVNSLVFLARVLYQSLHSPNSYRSALGPTK